MSGLRFRWFSGYIRCDPNGVAGWESRRANLDRGGWENTLMTNSSYTATNPLMAVGVGSGVTTPIQDKHRVSCVQNPIPEPQERGARQGQPAPGPFGQLA